MEFCKRFVERYCPQGIALNRLLVRTNNLTRKNHPDSLTMNHELRALYLSNALAAVFALVPIEVS